MQGDRCSFSSCPEGPGHLVGLYKRFAAPTRLTNVTGRFRSKRDILRKGGGSSSSNHSYSGQKEEKPLLMTLPVPVLLFILKETVLAVPERQRKTLGKGKIRRGSAVDRFIET